MFEDRVILEILVLNYKTCKKKRRKEKVAFTISYYRMVIMKMTHYGC